MDRVCAEGEHIEGLCECACWGCLSRVRVHKESVHTRVCICRASCSVHECAEAEQTLCGGSGNLSPGAQGTHWSCLCW